MIRSMTGYGRGQRSFPGLDITVELRSVNHRYFDCSVRIPRLYVSLEEPVKSYIQRHVARGKVDVFVTIEHTEEAGVGVTLNRPLLDAYLEALEEMRRTPGIFGDIELMSLARFPELFQIRKEEADPDYVRDCVLKTLEEALEGYLEMSRAEGERLRKDILDRAALIEAAVDRVAHLAEENVSAYRERLWTKLREVLESTDIEESRILTEAALYADRTAVDEETVRLKSHLSQLRDMLEKGGQAGRKLDFLIQEFNREANTIGSKAGGLETVKEVVDMKAEIEKIREQVQNIE